jgi:hypothetical protein
VNDRQDQNLNDIDLNSSNFQNTQARRDVIAAQNSQVTINKSFISLFGNRQEPAGIDWEWANRVIDLQLTQIQIRLQDTLLQNQLLTIDLQEQPQAVGRSPLESNWQLQSQGKNIETIDPDRLAIEIFGRKDIQGKLLILGRPGAGKTTVLLKLTEQLIAGAKQHSKTVIPVMFELSAWNKDDQSIRDFAIEQLYENVGGDRKQKIYEQWLDRGVLLPLFDGLDELGLDRQQKCTIKLNEFANHYPQMVVCCRVKEFETVGLELNRLNGAIVLQPLSDGQIQDYLQSVDRSGLWVQIQDTPEMKQMLQPVSDWEPGLLQIPLFIFLAAKAYKRDRPFSSKWELIENYIDSQLDIEVRKRNRRRKELEGRKWAFKSTEKEPRYRESRSSLVWVAEKLQQHHQVELLIEKMQPSWLEITRVKQAYRLIVVIIVASIFGFLSVLVTGNLTFASVLGFLSGLLGLMWADSEIKLVESWTFSIAKSASQENILNAIFIMMVVGVIFGLLSPSTEAIDRGAKFARYRQFTSLQEYVSVQASQPGVEVFRRNDRGQWVLSEYNLADSLHLESIDVNISIADLYRQVEFEIEL